MLLSSELGFEVRIRRRAAAPAFFERKAVQALETSFGLDLSVGATLRGAAPTFGHDFDGDGRRDVLLSQGGKKMVLNRGLARKDRLFEEDGKISLSAAGSNTTVVLHPRVKDKRKPDVLVYYVARKNMASKLVLFLNRY